MLETFALRLSLGMLLALVVLPIGEVPSRFYRIHLLIVLGLVTLAGVVGRHHESASFWLGLGLAGACCFLGTWFWFAEPDWWGHGPIVLGIASTGLALAQVSPESGSLLWSIFENASSSAQLGLVVTAMLLGHYYLIAPGLSVRPLVRLVQWLMAAILGRAGGAIIEASSWIDQLKLHSGTAEAWLWLALRWTGGIIAAALFAVLAWRCACLRSTQSATGILYAAVIATFLGELAQLLLARALAY